MLDYDSSNALACHFMGVTLTALFYGITLGQTWYYFRTYQKDPLVMRMLVGLLWLLDTAQLVLVIWSLFNYTVRWRGNMAAAALVSKQFIASLAVTSIVAFIVQLIYAYRIWRLSFNDVWLTLSIVILAFFALASGVAMVIKTNRDPRWDHTSVSNTPASLILASTVACDAVIALSQVYLFQKYTCHRHGRLGSLISKLTLLVVNVGLLTSIDVAVFLVLFLVCPLNGMFIVPYLLLSNFYLNSFLSVVNSRRRLRSIADNDNDDMHTSIFDVYVQTEADLTFTHPTFPTLASSYSYSPSRSQTYSYSSCFPSNPNNPQRRHSEPTLTSTSMPSRAPSVRLACHRGSCSSLDIDLNLNLNVSVNMSRNVGMNVSLSLSGRRAPARVIPRVQVGGGTFSPEGLDLSAIG